jgi:hypothetical protein
MLRSRSRKFCVPTAQPWFEHRYGKDDRKLESRRSKSYFSSPKCLDWLWGAPRLLLNGTRRSFLGVKRGWRVNFFPLSSFDTKTQWSRISTPTTCLLSVYRGDFTFLTHLYRRERQVIRYAKCWPMNPWCHISVIGIILKKVHEFKKRRINTEKHSNRIILRFKQLIN